MKTQLEYLYNFAAFLAHAFVSSAQRGFSGQGNTEAIYRALFLRELHQMNLPDIYYPVGGAANHSLLYLLARIATEFRVPSMIEFGSGQMTLLLDQIRTATGFPSLIVSIENDNLWADYVSSITNVSVVRGELVSKKIAGRTCYTYDLVSKFPAMPRFDCFVADGPSGSFRWSRWGALEVIQNLMEREFIVIFDDSDRIGEVDTIRECRRLLQCMQIEYNEKAVRADTSQHVFFTARYQKIAMF